MTGGGASLPVWLGTVSAVVFADSAAAVPYLAARIPADCFLRERGEKFGWQSKRPLLYGLLRIGRNFLGALLLLAGIVMLFVPGQGIITMFLGLTLLEFPGKLRFEKALIRRRAVSRALNWMRRRKGRRP